MFLGMGIKYPQILQKCSLLPMDTEYFPDFEFFIKVRNDCIPMAQRIGPDN